MTIPTTLAIDFGTKRVGLAISHALLADPILTFPNNDHLFDAINIVCQREKVEQILVGMSEQKMADQTEEFIRQLRLHTSLPVIVTDETLSSQQAIGKLRQARSKRRHGSIDHFAAAEILQSWIDEQR